MKRFVCMLLTMLSVAFLLPSAIAAEPGKEDVYLRILGTNGTITTVSSGLSSLLSMFIGMGVVLNVGLQRNNVTVQ